MEWQCQPKTDNRQTANGWWILKLSIRSSSCQYNSLLLRILIQCPHNRPEDLEPSKLTLSTFLICLVQVTMALSRMWILS